MCICSVSVRRVSRRLSRVGVYFVRVGELCVLGAYRTAGEACAWPPEPRLVQSVRGWRVWRCRSRWFLSGSGTSSLIGVNVTHR